MAYHALVNIGIKLDTDSGGIVKEKSVVITGRFAADYQACCG
jgi:hypothetical protein